MYNHKTIEEEAKKVWKKYNKEIKQALQNDTKKKKFSFLEGPPTANGPPGLHHLEVRTFKDIICKYKYMQGFSVPRKGGWDCHGLPVEVQIEKELKLNSKKDIEKYGVSKFINKCRDSVFSHIEEWNKSTEELNYWIDLENPYVTLNNNYIESVWWALKEMYKKGYLYEGYKVVPYCPRCGTPLSSHEVAQGYQDIKEESVYIAFKIKNRVGEYILAWTTTPWTLPGNVALAVGKNIPYVKVKLPDGDYLILGKDRLNILRGEYEILENFKGEDLVGLEYEPLFDIKELKNENSYKIILANFVTTEDGTGIVHTAGMYGEDDYNVCKENNLPLIHTVDPEGKFNSLVPQFKGKFVKSVEEDIKLDLKKRHLLYKTEKTTHAYPFCWRCGSPLLYYAINSWFIKVTAVRDRLVELNKKINWYPEHIKDGRFGKWLEGAKDWALSRFKFWGTPLPIWRCDCGEEEAIGSIEELKKRASKKITGEIDLHKPWIDDVKLKCKCGKEMKRIPDVIDCWFDSGSASFAQFHYPFENKEEFSKRYPYDFISEAIDQTRGWFYTLHVIGTILFDKPAYKNVICAGHIVDEKGEKMSKTKGNIIKPEEIIEKTGVDAVRLQFCTSDAENFKRFSYELMKECVIPFLTVLENCLKYYEQTENQENFLTGKFSGSSKRLHLKMESPSFNDKKNIKKTEDKWIISRLNSVIKKVTEGLENYSIDQGFCEINNFVVNDLSRTYIKITREREDIKDVLGGVLKKVSLLLAPYAPYITELIYQKFDNNSVHLSNWPKADEKLIDKKLEEDFRYAFAIIEKGLHERDKAQVGLKWPLAKAIVTCEKKLDKELLEIIKMQLNLKKIELKKRKEISVELDTKLTPELEAEGFLREILRRIQDARKKAGFVKTDLIKLAIAAEDSLNKIIESQKDFIKERTNSKELFIGQVDEKGYKNRFEDKIKGKKIVILFNKV